MSDTAQSVKRPSRTKKSEPAAPLIATWVDALEGEEASQFFDLNQMYRQAYAPTVATLLTYFGVDPKTVPQNNAFYPDGFITNHRPIEGEEFTVTGYVVTEPTLVPYPEGLTFELLLSALRFDAWGF